MNKRGAFGSDIGLVLAILLLFGVIVIVGYKIFSDYNDEWQAKDDVSTQSKEIVGTLQGRYVNLFDGIFLFIFAGLGIALLISSVTIGTRPEFFFATLILTVIFVGISAVLSNVYSDVSTNPELNTTSQEFNVIPYLLGNLPMVTLVFAFLVMIGLYVKVKLIG